jgi:UDP-N-acetylmuramoyl-L-alanyl-D-glutamate--2,6-diaminopimelate ligase
VLLSDLLDGVVDPTISDARPEGDPLVPHRASDLSGIDVVSITIDDRDVMPGAMFACVRGDRHDGHDHAAAAVASGAVVVLAERPIDDIPWSVPQIIVRSVRQSLGPLAARLNGSPSKAMRIVGVTGTNGKTTVTYMVESIARAAGRSVGVLGTLGVRWGSSVDPTTFTTPEAPSLQRTLATMRAAGVEVAAMEVSSHALEYCRVDGTTFAAVGFTNLSAEHLDLHGDLDQYFEAKARLFSTPFTDRAVVCVDEQFGTRLAARAASRGLAVTTVASTADAANNSAVDIGLRARSVRCDAHGSEFDVCGPAGELHISLALLGAFNVANAMVAIGLARAIDIDDAAIRTGLATLARVPGRLDPVPNGRDITLIVDYAHTPEALATVLSTLRALAAPAARVIAVYGCGGDRDRSKRPAMGRVVARGADRAILTSDNPRSEAPETIADDVLRGLDADDPRPEVELDRRSAIRRALHWAEPGDVVLIAGKGHETGQTAAGITTTFDDRVVATQLLAELGSLPCS